MSHNVETMAYAGETPWHGLGKKTLHDLTPAQFLKEAGIDWGVQKVPNYYVWNNEARMTGDCALVRDSDGMVLSTVGKDWCPTQNAQMAEFFHDFVMKNQMSIETAGSLQNGKIVWMMARTNEAFELCNGKDVVENFLLFSNYFKFGFSNDIRNTDIRVVCNNTFSAAHAKEAAVGITFNHMKEFSVEHARNALARAKKAQQEYREKAEFLTQRRYQPGQSIEYFGQLFPTDSKSVKFSRNAEMADALVNTQPGAELGEGSWWQLFNAVTFMADHKIGHSQDTRLASSWYGNLRKVKTKALDLALEYAEAV